MYPEGEDVWNSFWNKETEERQMRTRIFELSLREIAFEERCLRVEDRAVREVEFAQKQVTKMSSCSVDSRAGRIVSSTLDPVPRARLKMEEDAQSVEGSFTQ